MFDAAQQIRSHIREIPAYEPILPFQVLSEQIGIPVERIVKLDANENPYGPVPEAQQALASLEFAHIYPDPEARELRAALSKLHGVPLENLVCGAGADELIDLIIRLFIDPGDRILNFPPTFGMYAFDSMLNRAVIVDVPRDENFRLDIEKIKAACEQHQPKLLFLTNPNNPDGGTLPEAALLQLLELPVLLVLDEAYMEFASDSKSYLKEAVTRKNLVVLRTFSKWAGLAGLRVGYGVFPQAIATEFWKIKQPYNVSAAASAAAVASLNRVDLLQSNAAKIIAERARLAGCLAEFPWLKVFPSQANFVLCKVSGKDARQVKESLARQGIFVRYFNKPGLQDCLRVSVGKPEQSDAFIQALRDLE